MNKQVISWIFLALIMAGGLSLLASSHPDGFEKAGEQTGYLEQAVNIPISLFPDYTIPEWDTMLANSMVGMMGVLLTFILFWVIGRWITRKIR